MTLHREHDVLFFERICGIFVSEVSFLLYVWFQSCKPCVLS